MPRQFRIRGLADERPAASINEQPSRVTSDRRASASVRVARARARRAGAALALGEPPPQWGRHPAYGRVTAGQPRWLQRRVESKLDWSKALESGKQAAG
jgi:hypothetical protein